VHLHHPHIFILVNDRVKSATQAALLEVPACQALLQLSEGENLHRSKTAQIATLVFCNGAICGGYEKCARLIAAKSFLYRGYKPLATPPCDNAEFCACMRLPGTAPAVVQRRIL